MPGLLSEGGVVAPEEQAMPEEEVMVEESTSPEGEPTDPQIEDDLTDDAAIALEKATEIAYSEEGFPKLVAAFKKTGTKGFPKTMALAVTSTLQKTEEDMGEKLDQETIAQVGARLFEMLTEDMASSGTVTGLNAEIVGQAMKESLTMWGKQNPDRFDPKEFEKEMMGVVEGEGGITPQPQPQNMVPDEAAMGAPPPQQAPRPQQPPQGGGMLMGGM
jgi:hypothetical protein